MEEPKRSYKVYCWTNRINGKRYVGLTCQPMYKRAGAHMHHYEKSPYFWSAIQKYDEDAFECRILVSNLTLQEAEQKERNYIKRYRSANHQYGYNIEKGGAHSQTEATLDRQRRRTKEALTNSPKMQAYRKRLSKEMPARVKDPSFRAAMSEGLKRMWSDPEIKAKRTARMKQMWADPDMRAHILAARKATGKQCGPYKPVRVYCKETDTTYDTVAELEAAINIQIKSIMRRYIQKGQYTFVVGTRKGTPYTITRLQ